MPFNGLNFFIEFSFGGRWKPFLFLAIITLHGSTSELLYVENEENDRTSAP